MKVLYVGGLDSAQKGAVGTHTLGVLRGFQEAGIDVHAVFLDDQVPDAFQGSTTLVRAAARDGYYKKVADRVRIARAASKLAPRYDYVYVRHDPFISPLISADNLVLEYNDDFFAQIEFTIKSGHYGRIGGALRSGPVYSGLVKRLERRCFRKAVTVVGITGKLCSRVSQREPASRTFCMLNGSDASYDPALDAGYSDEILRIGHIGTLTYWDGLKELLNALHLFRKQSPEKQVKLLILGDGPLKQELTSLSKELSLDDMVEFRSSVDRSAALAYLHQMDVVPLLKTLASYDLSPMKLYEALCVGRFLLCSNIPHINELDADQGMVVKFPLDVQEIAQALSDMHAKLQDIRSGFRARSEKAQRDHSWKHRVDLLITHLESLAHEHAGKAGTVRGGQSTILEQKSDAKRAMQR